MFVIRNEFYRSLSIQLEVAKIDTITNGNCFLMMN